MIDDDLVHPGFAPIREFLDGLSRSGGDAMGDRENIKFRAAMALCALEIIDEDMRELRRAQRGFGQ
jgi:hypothetical protein